MTPSPSFRGRTPSTRPTRATLPTNRRLIADIERRVVRAVQARGALLPGERVVVAVSGGPDSTALLLILARLAPKLGLTLSTAHVDHGVRPAAERAADSDFVRALSAKLGLPCTVEVAKPRGASEDALRRARYAALRRAASRFGATAVALGHTADDQAETVLLHLVRGAGLDGLAGMRPRAPWPFRGEGPALARPLLDLRRAETDAYARARGESPRVDASNIDARYARNRLRAGALPALVAENPNVVEAIARAARSVGEALALVQEEADRAWPSVANETPGSVTLRAVELTSLPGAVRHAIVRRAVLAALPDANDGVEVGADALARIDDLLAGGSGRRASLGGGVWASRTVEWVRIGGREPAAPPLPETPLRVPGTTRVGPWQIEAGASFGKLRMTADGAALGDPYSLDLTEEIATRGLLVRSRRPGDRIHLAGGTRKVQDVLVDAKVPREQRDAVPLLCDATGRVLWVVGHAADPDARGGGLRLRFRHAEG